MTPANISFFSSRSNKPLYFKCEPCNTKVLSTLAMCLHVWTSRHLVKLTIFNQLFKNILTSYFIQECSWHYNNSVDCFTSSEPEPPVNFCSICSKHVDENDDAHLSSEGKLDEIKKFIRYLQISNFVHRSPEQTEVCREVFTVL